MKIPPKNLQKAYDAMDQAGELPDDALAQSQFARGRGIPMAMPGRMSKPTVSPQASAVRNMIAEQGARAARGPSTPRQGPLPVAPDFKKAAGPVVRQAATPTRASKPPSAPPVQPAAPASPAHQRRVPPGLQNVHGQQASPAAQPATRGRGPRRNRPADAGQRGSATTSSRSPARGASRTVNSRRRRGGAQPAATTQSTAQTAATSAATPATTAPTPRKRGGAAGSSASTSAASAPAKTGKKGGKKKGAAASAPSADWHTQGK